MHQEYIKHLWLYRMGMMDTLDILGYNDKRAMGLILAKGCAGLSEIQFAIDGKEFNKEWYNRMHRNGYADALFTFIEHYLISKSLMSNISNNQADFKEQVQVLLYEKTGIINVTNIDSIPDEIYPVYLILYALHGGGKIFPVLWSSMWKRFARSYIWLIM